MSSLFFQLSLAIYLADAATYLVYFITRKKALRTVARRIFFAAAILHTGAIVARFVEVGHVPITSMHETVSFFAWAVSWSYLSFRWRHTVNNLGTFVSLLVLALMVVAALASHRPIPLEPVLQSWWLSIHPSVTLFAYAFLALSCIGGLMYLLQEREIKGKRFGMFYTRLPSLEALDKLNHHCLSIGFLLLTLGLITGAFWAKQAWGTYFRWNDVKMIWSLVTWLLYAAVVHQRFTVGWRGRRAAILSIIAFMSVLFTLWGVALLMEGVHVHVS